MLLSLLNASYAVAAAAAAVEGPSAAINSRGHGYYCTHVAAVSGCRAFATANVDSLDAYVATITTTRTIYSTAVVAAAAVGAPVGETFPASASVHR